MTSSGTTGAIGRARALTVMSPVPRRLLVVPRLMLLLKRFLGPDPKLQRLSFIHAAHWAVIPRPPGAGERPRYGYVLFVSNFNGSWRDYIDAFAIAIPGRMAALWGTAFGFPGALPPTPFVQYIERNQLAPAHYYAAYPEASVTEVASALRVQRAFTEQVAPASVLDDEHVAASWRAFVDTVQRDL